MTFQKLFKIANLILYADDVSIIITNNNQAEFRNTINLVLIEINNWFQSNPLTLIFDKTHFLQFLTKKTE